MVAILKVPQASAICLYAWPHPTALVFQHPPITSLGRGADVVRQVLPAAPRVQDIQNPIEHFPLIFSGAAGASGLGNPTLDPVPLGVGDIGAIWLA
jgi:hypothetical protein